MVSNVRFAIISNLLLALSDSCPSFHLILNGLIMLLFLCNCNRPSSHSAAATYLRIVLKNSGRSKEWRMTNDHHGGGDERGEGIWGSYQHNSLGTPNNGRKQFPS